MNRLKNVTLLLLLSTLGGCGEDPQEAGIADVRPELGVEGSSPAILELRVTTDLPDDYVFEFEGDVAGHPYMEVSTVPGVTDPFETLQGTYTLQPVHDPTLFELYEVACSDQDSSFDPASAVLTVRLGPDETLLCQFSFRQAPMGTIQIRKDVIGGSDALFDFAWSGGDSGGGGSEDSDAPVVDFQLGDGELSQMFTLPPGNHTFWEVDSDPDWALADLVCTGDEDDGSWIALQDREVEIDLDADEDILCVFTNRYRPGTIIIEYESDPPGGSAELLEGTSGSPIPFVLNDGESRTFSGLYPGSQQFRSNSDHLTVDAYCDDENSVGIVQSRLIEVNLEDGEVVTCRFVERLRVGTIVVRKQTIPTGGTGFAFEAPGPDGSSTVGRTLNDGGEWTFGWGEGTAQVREILEPGSLYELIDVQCEDPDGGTVWDPSQTGSMVEYDLDPGETVSCLFINEKTTGTVIIRAASDPAGGTGFPYATDLPGAVSFSLDDGQFRAAYDVPEGSYSVQQLENLPFVVGNVTCTDPDGGTSWSAGSASAALDVDRGETVECTFTNVNQPAPTADPGGPYVGLEGTPVSFDGSGSTNPGGGSLSYEWDFGDGTGSTEANPSHAYADNGVYTVSLKVLSGSVESAVETTTATIGNVAPTITLVSGPFAPVPVGTPVTLEAEFGDPGVNDAVWTGEMDWGDGSSGPTTSSSAVGSAGAGASGSIGASHTYGTPGVYAVGVTVRDKDGGEGMATYEYVVVYDPDGGFVTGGGWIQSPAGAYVPDPTLTGRANFGFVSKYKKGANKPDGNTEFQFKAADLNFQSTDYDWLVVAGAMAQFKGSGSINGVPGYGFLLKAIDGDADGGGGVDRFRIKIWEADTETVVYDNQPGAGDDADPTTALGGGNIVVHKARNKK